MNVSGTRTIHFTGDQETTAQLAKTFGKKYYHILTGITLKSNTSGNLGMVGVIANLKTEDYCWSLMLSKILNFGTSLSYELSWDWFKCGAHTVTLGAMGLLERQDIGINKNSDHYNFKYRHAHGYGVSLGFSKFWAVKDYALNASVTVCIWKSAKGTTSVDLTGNAKFNLVGSSQGGNTFGGCLQINHNF